MSRNLSVGIIIIFLAALIAGCWYALHGDILFHTDIARDFLVLQDIVDTQKPTLIGPRSGGIPGVFHGPLWYYIHLPVFIIGHGNPAVIAWFWVFLSAVSVGVTYYCGKKLFSAPIAGITALLLSVYLFSTSHALSNPFGAVILFPVFFFLLRRYITTLKGIYFTAALFCLGCIIQFQMAFGVPLLFLTVLFVVPLQLRQKKLMHSISYLILLLPLSTHILFELRHDFLQIRSVMHYITTHQDVGEMSFSGILLTRIQGVLLDGLNVFPANRFLTIPITLLFGWLLFKMKDKKLRYRDNYVLFFFFYIGFWVIATLFKGVIWSYYYWPFLPLTLLILASLLDHIEKRVFIALIVFIFLFNAYNGLHALGGAGSGWQFYHHLAQDIYRDAAGREFGYYIFTPDQFAYSEKYAVLYTQKEFPDTQRSAYEKKPLTYLIIAPPPADQPWMDGAWWREHQVQIHRPADKVHRYDNGFIIETYFLTPEELKIPSDPNLIQDLTFR